MLLDETRLADVARDFGADFNPFDVHRQRRWSRSRRWSRGRASPSRRSRPASTCWSWTRRTTCAGRRGQPGDAGLARGGADRRARPARAAADRDAARGRRARLLPAAAAPAARRSSPRTSTSRRGSPAREPLPPCTSSTRRERHRRPAAARAAAGRRPRGRLGGPGGAGGRRARASPRRTRSRAAQGRPVRRALASGAALAAVLGARTRRSCSARPRRRTRRTRACLARWREAPRWKAARREDARLRARTARRSRCCAPRSASARSSRPPPSTRSSRPRAATSRSRSSGGPRVPSLLVSTECGGEGRNFEFCHRLVLFDLPWNPVVVEQRIGRLDRIGRALPVEIVYFRPPAGIGADVVRLFEAIGLFREPLAGPRSRSWRASSRRSRRPPLEPEGRLAADAVRRARRATRARRGTRIREAAYRELHRDPLPAGAGGRHPGARARRPRRAQPGRWSRSPASRLGFQRRAAARPAALLDRVRQRGARRQPARRARRLQLPGHVRPRGGGGGRDARLLRGRPSAGRRRAGAPRGGAERARGRAPASRPGPSAASACSPSTRMGRRSR